MRRSLGGGDGGVWGGQCRKGARPKIRQFEALKGDLTAWLSGSLRVCKQVQSDHPLALILSASEIRDIRLETSPHTFLKG